MFTKHLESCVSCYAFSSLLFLFVFSNLFFLSLVFHCIFDLFIASCPIVNEHEKEKEMSIQYSLCEGMCVTMCRFHFRMRNKYLLAEACLYCGTRAFLSVCVRAGKEPCTWTHVLWHLFCKSFMALHYRLFCDRKQNLSQNSLHFYQNRSKKRET